MKWNISKLRQQKSPYYYALALGWVIAWNRPILPPSGYVAPEYVRPALILQSHCSIINHIKTKEKKIASYLSTRRSSFAIQMPWISCWKKKIIIDPLNWKNYYEQNKGGKKGFYHRVISKSIKVCFSAVIYNISDFLFWKKNVAIKWIHKVKINSYKILKASTFQQEQKSLLQAHCKFPRPLWWILSLL